MNKTNNILAVLALLCVGVALINLGVTINKIGDFKTLTGFATDTGTANLTIASAASVSFITDNIDWGYGKVDEAPASAWMDSEGNVVDGNWTAVAQGLTIRNDGNINVTLNLSASNDADGFIGGTSPSYNWKVSNNESDACQLTINISTDTSAGTTHQVACDNFGYVDVADALDIDVNVTVPEDASSGAKGSIITATATAI